MLLAPLATVWSLGAEIEIYSPKRRVTPGTPCPFSATVDDRPEPVDWTATLGTITEKAPGMAVFIAPEVAGPDAQEIRIQAKSRNSGLAGERSIWVHPLSAGAAQEVESKEDRQPRLEAFAGDPDRPGHQDGLGPSAGFTAPFGLLLLDCPESKDLHQTFLVADRDDHRIRKVSRSGRVGSWLGTGQTPGFQDGAGAAATFRGPTFLAQLPCRKEDPLGGDVVIADTGNHALRLADLAGNVQTLVGKAGPGFLDGPLALARFRSPRGIAVDEEGDIYVADADNYVIRKILRREGQVVTLAGKAEERGFRDGTGEDARFLLLRGLVRDGRTGDLYVADAHSIRKLDRAGKVTTVAGMPHRAEFEAWLTQSSLLAGEMRMAGVACFNSPQGMAWHRGCLFIADGWNNAVRMFNPVTGDLTTLVGHQLRCGTNSGFLRDNGKDAPPSRQPMLKLPWHLAFGGDGWCIIPSGNGLVQLLDLEGWPGFPEPAGSESRIPSPEPVAPESASAQAAPRAGLPQGTSIMGPFKAPAGVACMNEWTQTGPRRRILVADPGRFVIDMVGEDGVAVPWVGKAGESGCWNGTREAARLTQPMHLATRPGHALGDGVWDCVFTEPALNVVRHVDGKGSVTILAGQVGKPGYVDSPVGSALFFSPAGVAMSPDGEVFVADHTAVRCITRGKVWTLAGKPGTPGAVDGKGGAARFIALGAMARDHRNGNLYVVDGNCVKRVTPRGEVTTVLGNMAKAGFVAWPEGAPPRYGKSFKGVPCLSAPKALVVHGSWLYIADSGNNGVPILDLDHGSVGSLSLGLAGIGGSRAGCAARMAGIAFDDLGGFCITAGGTLNWFGRSAPAGAKGREAAATLPAGGTEPAVRDGRAATCQ